MPARWRCAPAGRGGGSELLLWPHRSLSRGGFALFIGVTFLLLLVPLLSFLGTSALWVLLPILMGALTAIWIAIRCNDRQVLRLSERLVLTQARVSLVRHEPRRADRRWEANPAWVSVHLHRKGARVENYVTLRGGGREVEIGAFLSPDERLILHDELAAALGHLRGGG